MNALKHKAPLTPNHYLALYKNVIFQELHAIISAKDFKSQYSNFTTEDKKTIKANQNEIAEAAARHFIKNNGSDLTKESEVEKLIHKSIKEAIKVFK